jgi:tetratricopeptide (TPR) repeat protein
MNRCLSILLAVSIAGAASGPSNELRQARDRQDLAALQKIILQDEQAVKANEKSADAQYALALANSYAAEVAQELRDKKKAQAFAEAGVDAAQKAVAIDGANAEYHRVLGGLCGQVIPANPFLGALKYGQCARDELNKAIQLNANLALAYVSRGVGYTYLPPSFGGGIELALQDFDKAIAINPNLADAYLWKGVALHKANQNAAARQALEKALQLEPNRLWAKQELDKTPAS